MKRCNLYFMFRLSFFLLQFILLIDLMLANLGILRKRPRAAHSELITCILRVLRSSVRFAVLLPHALFGIWGFIAPSFSQYRSAALLRVCADAFDTLVLRRRLVYVSSTLLLLAALLGHLTDCFAQWFVRHLRR